MLTPFLRCLFSKRLPVQPHVPLCVPEWSETMAEQHASIWWQIKPHTALSVESMISLCQSVAYLEKHDIQGGIVIFGVGNGGNAMAAALSLLALDSTQREIYLYDAFNSATLQVVKQTLMQTRYPWEKFRFVPPVGKAEAPQMVALLRLATETYHSNYYQLEHLYPHLAERGILMVETCEAKQAMNDYFQENGIDAEARLIGTAGDLLIKRSQPAILQAA